MKYIIAAICIILSLTLILNAEEPDRNLFNMGRTAPKKVQVPLPPEVILPKGEYLKNGIKYQKSLDSGPDWSYDSNMSVWRRSIPIKYKAPCPPDRP